MGDLTLNISRHELKCKCDKCDYAAMDFETVRVVQSICDYFATTMMVKKVILKIHSAARCFEYNRIPFEEGGPGSNDNSQHPRCNAMDFSIVGIKNEDIYNYINTRYPQQYGVGHYSWGIHLDTCRGYARW